MAALVALGQVALPTGSNAAASHVGRSSPEGSTRIASGRRPAIISVTRAQTIDGFGASGDWWPTDLVHFPTAARRSLASLLFSKNGIMLSQYRYNIGGGGVGVTAPDPGESELGPKSRAPQSMYVSPGHYDWSHDRGGTEFLRYAAQYHVPRIEANVNSAPWAFTSNHQSCGGQLKASAIPAYARYLLRVVQHAHRVWHTTLSDVSPMNEPDYSRSTCTQEGMFVPPRERARVVLALGKAFRRSARYAHVIADESSQVATQLLPEAPGWLSVAGVSRSLGALATHTYDFPSNATLARAAAVARQYGKQLWMTEICCMVGTDNQPRYGEGYDPGMRGALPMAHLIWKDLTYGRMSSWDWWAAASPSLGCDPATSNGCAAHRNSDGYNAGLLYYDPDYGKDHDYVFYKTKRFWTLGNFSRFVRPGAVLHPVSGSPPGVYLLAFANVRRWQLVAINEGESGWKPFSFRFPDRATLTPAGAFRTGRKANLAAVSGARRLTNGTFTARLPPQSVTTYLFRPT